LVAVINVTIATSELAKVGITIGQDGVRIEIARRSTGT
jgi:hypothetical protein